MKLISRAFFAVTAVAVLPVVGPMVGGRHPFHPHAAAASTIVSQGDPAEQTAIRSSRRFRLAQRQLTFDHFSGGRRDEKLVALTFDDGPDPEVTPAILEILKREHVPATFFIIGEKAERYPDLIRREAIEGHDFGNHTYHHLELTELNADAVKFEIQRTNQTLARILGGPTRWFRAPGCHYTVESVPVIRDSGMIRVDTTDNSGDWDRYGVSAIMRRVLGHLSPGDVLLCHDRVPKTIEALPQIIAALRKRGYRFVPLAELALRAQRKPGFEPVEWPRNEGITYEGLRLRPASRHTAIPAKRQQPPSAGAA